ncbi:hybrid sensor histidine kinase/response regulator [Rubrivivax rivuli]|uniref:histidine kinase n=1 Tax=Rubrivivax rivuli TaxID=1862385 RepID=A0A437RCS5_9BURK|nr:PAS domain-containing hybrid sensor histidine kinase/response regulator [Rubrivivax rivuli]RVU44550.1 PAS domain-containing sensor histidine kinase [Rubrivivax rivuli]
MPMAIRMLPALPTLEQLPCAVLRLDTGGRVAAVNALLCEWLGRPEEALQGQPADALLTVPSRVIFQSRVLPLLRLNGHADEVTLALLDAQGAPVHVLMYARRRPGDAGVACDAVLVPVRQRRQLEEETLRVRRAADLSPYMIFQLWVPPDVRQARFPYASEAIRWLYGESAEAAALSAENVFRHVHPDDQGRVQSTLQAAVAGMVPWQVRYRVQAPAAAAAVWHELNASPRGLADGQTLWHGHVGDITARVALEEAMAQQHAAEGAARARSAFLARVSHELRTPLNGILGFAQLLAHEEADRLSEVQRRRVHTIESAGRTLLELVDEVLDLNAIDSGQFKVTPARVAALEVAAQAVAMAGPAAAKAGLTLSGPELPAPQPDADPGWHVQADARRLLQVLGALLSNAVKYTPAGGSVALRLSAADKGVLFTVADTGIGLSAAQQAALFEPFNRLGAERTATPGSGLGLVIARGLVGLMGGHLQVRSATGAGSDFAVWLPMAPLEPARSAAVPAADAPGPGCAEPPAAGAPPGRLLYVEDNEVNALLMQAIVALRPALQMQVVPDMAGALVAARETPPDLVLLDLHLPDGDGYTLLRALRGLPGLQQVPAVVVSASAHAEERQRALAAGFVGYWTKPLDLAQTLAELDRMLNLAARARRAAG